MKFIKLLSLYFFLLSLWDCNPRNKQDRIPQIEKGKEFSLEPQLNALTDAIEDNPDNDEYYFKRAKIYLDGRKFNPALADINQAISLEKGNEDYYYLLGKIYHSMGKNTFALKAAQQAESFNSQNPDLYILIADIYWDLNDLKNSDFYVNKAADLAPMHSEINVLKARVMARKGDTSGAARTLKDGLNKDRENVDSYKELIKIYESQKKYDSALYYIVAAREVDRFDPYWEFYEGKVYEDLKLIESAKRSYVAAINKDSSFYQAGYRLALINYHQNNLALAYNSLIKVLPFENGDKDINLLLGELSEKLNRGPEAIGYYEKVLMKDTSNVQAKTGLNNLYQLYPNRKKIVHPDTLFKNEVVAKPTPHPHKDTASIKKAPVTGGGSNTKVTKKLPTPSIKPPAEANPNLSEELEGVKPEQPKEARKEQEVVKPIPVPAPQNPQPQQENNEQDKEKKIKLPKLFKKNKD